MLVGIWCTDGRLDGAWTAVGEKGVWMVYGWRILVYVRCMLDVCEMAVHVKAASKMQLEIQCML